MINPYMTPKIPYPLLVLAIISAFAAFLMLCHILG